MNSKIMNLEREIQRIISGTLRCKLSNGNTLLLKTPSRYHRYIAEEIYLEVYNEAMESKMFTEAQLMDFMVESNLWTIEEQKTLSTLSSAIDDLKVQMYENLFKSSEITKAKKILLAAKADFIRLSNKKSQLLHTCAEGYANIEKNKYLISHSLFYVNGKPLVEDDDNYSILSSYLIEEAIFIYKENRLDDDNIREISKSQQWKNQWGISDKEKIFGIPTVDLSEEQKTLISWSTLYDNIYQNPECPSEEVMQDDDLLDGWMITQKRKHKAEKNSTDANIISNEKIRNSSEVFIVPSMENKKDFDRDMSKISSLNNMEADLAKRQRLGYLRKKGVVLEADMPDSRREIITQFMEKQKVG